MMNSPFTSMNLGLPSPKPKKKGKGKPSSHLAQAAAAHKAGDHSSAKKHALNAANALHALVKSESAEGEQQAIPNGENAPL